MRDFRRVRPVAQACQPLPVHRGCDTATVLKSACSASFEIGATWEVNCRRSGMPDKSEKIGWIGMGRMGFPMAERLLKAGHDVSIWNRTRAKAEPLAKSGGKIVDKPSDLAGVDVLFAI